MVGHSELREERPEEDHVGVITAPRVEEGDVLEDTVMHLVQDEQTVAELHQLELAPDEYYNLLREARSVWWPKADPLLLDHLMSVLIAFDTATGRWKHPAAQNFCELFLELIELNFDA